MSIDVFRVDRNAINKPYRVKIHGVTLTNSKGEIRKFGTMFEAMSKAQRILTRQERNK